MYLYKKGGETQHTQCIKKNEYVFSFNILSSSIAAENTHFRIYVYYLNEKEQFQEASYHFRVAGTPPPQTTNIYWAGIVQLNVIY